MPTETGEGQPSMTLERPGERIPPFAQRDVDKATKEARSNLRVRLERGELPLLSGGSPWLYKKEEDLQGLPQKLRDLFWETETTPPNLWDSQTLRGRYFEIQKAARGVKARTPQQRTVQDALIKINDRIQKLSEARPGINATPRARGRTLVGEEAPLTRIAEALTDPRAAIRRRINGEINDNPLGATGVLREKLVSLEQRSGTPFESPENQRDWGDINILLDEDMFPQLRGEYNARRSVHNISLIFAVAPDIKTARNAVSMNARELGLLLRIPGVAEALRQYEKAARIEKEAYRAVPRTQDNKARGSINPDLKLITANGDEIDAARARIANSQSVMEAVVAGLGRDLENRRILTTYAHSAQRLAERIWQITGRSSYWNQCIESPDKKGKFGFGGGRGEMSGYHFMGEKIFGLNSRLKRQVPGALELWFDKQPDPDGTMVNLWDTGARDFWTENRIKILEGMPDMDPETGFLDSLENVRFEDKNADWSNSPMLISWINDMLKADEAREALEKRVGSFLQTASPDKLWEIAGFYKHLNPAARDQIFGALLLTMVRLNLPVGVGRRAPIQEYHPKAKPWPRDFAEKLVNNAAESGGLITHRTAAKILEQTLGGRAERAIRREAPKVGGDIVAGIAAGVKNVLGLK